VLNNSRKLSIKSDQNFLIVLEYQAIRNKYLYIYEHLYIYENEIKLIFIKNQFLFYLIIY